MFSMCVSYYTAANAIVPTVLEDYRFQHVDYHSTSYFAVFGVLAGLCAFVYSIIYCVHCCCVSSIGWYFAPIQPLIFIFFVSISYGVTFGSGNMFYYFSSKYEYLDYLVIISCYSDHRGVDSSCYYAAADMYDVFQNLKAAGSGFYAFSWIAWGAGLAANIYNYYRSKHPIEGNRDETAVSSTANNEVLA